MRGPTSDAAIRMTRLNELISELNALVDGEVWQTFGCNHASYMFFRYNCSVDGRELSIEVPAEHEEDALEVLLDLAKRVKR